MTNLSSLKPTYITANATAVAADVAVGKVAYGAAGKVVGNAAVAPTFGSKTVAFWDFTAFPIGAFDPTLAGNGPQILPVGNITNAAGLTITANGLTNTSSGSLNINALPVKTGNRRQYIINYSYLDRTNPNNCFLDFNFNFLDVNNYWKHRVIGFNGSYYYTLLYSFISGSSVERGRSVWSGVNGAFVNACSVISDGGDNLQITDNVQLIGSTVQNGYATEYTVASRTQQAVTNCNLDWGGGNGYLHLSSILIQDF